ncbi:MAG: hypothetical protein BZ138_05485 [Methanosphaera sp. rholeuAM270]|nr:MAG: hypothetical protein BZ138_05485 [Methanosphaera sp. rholeuAM270]
MIFDILKDGLEYVGTNRKQTILYYIGILLFPLVLIESYSYHIIENCLNGMINNKDKLPDITLNPETIINGLKLLILKIIYYLPEIIIIILSANLARIDYYTITILLLVLTFISYTLSQIAGVHMVAKREFREGFNFTEIFSILKTVGLTYAEFIIATFVIILGIIGVSILFTTIIMLFSGISSIIFTILMLLIVLLYFIFLIVIIPVYALFKNRAIVSIYNLKIMDE